MFTGAYCWTKKLIGFVFMHQTTNIFLNLSKNLQEFNSDLFHCVFKMTLNFLILNTTIVQVTKIQLNNFTFVIKKILVLSIYSNYGNYCHQNCLGFHDGTSISPKWSQAPFRLKTTIIVARPFTNTISPRAGWYQAISVGTNERQRLLGLPEVAGV